MKTISVEVPDNLDAAVAESEADLPRALRLAAAIHWYGQGLISQGKGAEIAGLTRVEFIDAIGKAGVAALQTSVEELRVAGQDRLRLQLSSSRKYFRISLA